MIDIPYLKTVVPFATQLRSVCCGIGKHHMFVPKNNKNSVLYKFLRKNVSVVVENVNCGYSVY